MVEMKRERQHYDYASDDEVKKCIYFLFWDRRMRSDH